MRVLLNTKPLLLSGKTGVGYYVFNLFRALQKAGEDVVPTFDMRSRTLLTPLSKVSSRLRRLMGTRYPSLVGKAGDFLISRLSLKEENEAVFDLYHETSYDPIPEERVVNVCNLYDLSFVSCPELLIKEFMHPMKTNVTANVPRARRVMVNTQFIKDEAMNLLKIPEEKIDVIPLAPSRMYHQLDKRSFFKPKPVRRFTGKDFLLYVGTVEPRKNLKTLIRAFSDIRRNYDLSLIIAGSLGWMYDDVLSYPEELRIQEDVIFTRYVDERTLLYLYNHASVFVYPSLYEGFGLPPLEAMACGTPVIISDIPPLREVAGDAAIVFNPRDHEDLADKILMLLSSEALRAQQRERGLQKAGEYSWEKVAACTIQTYRKALGI